MTNKMEHFAGSSSFPQPGQIFTIRSISWVINADGDGEIIEPLLIDSASTTPAPAIADPISEPPPRLSPPPTRRPLPHYLRKQINKDDLITSVDQVGQKLTNCLSIAELALTTLVQHRPASDSDLSEANQETPAAMSAIHQDVLRGEFTDQVGEISPLADPITEQLSPTVNMLQIVRRPKASLHTILEENPDSES